MKYPKHVVLDLSKNFLNNSSQYWIFNYINKLTINKNLFSDLTFCKKFLIRKELIFKNKITLDQKKFTAKYSLTHPALFLNKSATDFYKNFYKIRYKVKHRDLYSKHLGKEIFDFLDKPNLVFNEKILSRIIKNFKFAEKSNYAVKMNFWSSFDINFLRKEKIYTKLKYSRVPQYDIVSGGVAALFAGLLGFLICEKFGFELLDSGDFYFLFMYLVFLVFSMRLYLRIINESDSTWEVVSLKWLIYFFQINFTLLINFFKTIFKI